MGRAGKQGTSHFYGTVGYSHPHPPPILNDILLLKTLFSEIYRAPKGQQLPFYPPGLGEEATAQKDFYRWLFPRKILFSHYKHDNGSGHMFQV